MVETGRRIRSESAERPPVRAGLLARAFAWIVDRFILGSLLALLGSWGLVIYMTGARERGELLGLALLGALLLLWGITLHAVYFVSFVGGCGQTPGMMLCGIAVVSRRSAAVGYGRAFLRWIGYGLALLPFGLGFLAVLFTRERRGLHDLIAGTRVIRRGAAYACDAL